MVRPKKFLGQHFLKDQNIASKIVRSLLLNRTAAVLEVGPGMGVLTKYLASRPVTQLKLVEIDRESVSYLKEHFPAFAGDVIEADFLRMDIAGLFNGPFALIGNFPYNISSQIFFKVLKNRAVVPEVVGMVQKEVADRIAARHGNKTYGILSVLLQAYYDVRLLFNVPPGVFIPPPKVTSAVIRLERNSRERLPCDEELFFKVVKQGFNNRRKTLRNALKNLTLPADILALDLLSKRAEQLPVEEFIHLTTLIQQGRAGVR